jgi:hypothetical protein
MIQVSIIAAIALLLSISPLRPLFAQAPRQVPITATTDIQRELFKYLVSTQQFDKGAKYEEEGKFMYQVDLLAVAQIPGVGIYKFGVTSAHEGYNVVFRYRDKLIFHSPTTSITSGQLLTLLGNFLIYYPNSYTLGQQKQLAERLISIVEHQRYLETQEF